MGFIFPYRVKVLSVRTIKANVVILTTEKPFRFEYERGQVVDLSIDKPGFELSVASFTIANAPEDTYLEFIVKVYPRKGLTEAIAELKPNDVVQVSIPYIAYTYKGSGTFIAAGAGITAFLPIFKIIEDMGANDAETHRLIYADKSKKDLLYYNRLKKMFNNRLWVTFSRSKARNLPFGRIDREYLSKTICGTEQNFYVCGPKKFEEDIKTHLVAIGVKKGNIQTGYTF